MIGAVSCGDSDESDSPATGGATGSSGATGKGGDSAAGETGSGEAGAAGASNASEAGAGGGMMAPALEPWDPDTLEWEALPTLAEGATENAGQVSIAVSRDGEIFLSASFAAEDWMPPWSQRVYQLVDGAWELLGGAPLEETAGVVSNVALAVAANGDVYNSYFSDEPHLYRFDGDAWSEVTVDADAADLAVGLIVSDGSGRIVAAGQTAGNVVAYRLEGSTWTRVGDSVVAVPAIPGVTAGLTASNDEIALAMDGNLHWFRDDSWNDLGPFYNAGATLPSFPTLAYEPDGSLLVNWREDEANGTVLYTSRWAPGASDFELLTGDLDFDTALDSSYSQLAVNAAAQIFCTWRESSVYVAHYVGSEWLPFIGDGDVAAHTSGGTLPDIALTSDGLPVVAWEAFNEGDSVVGASRAVAK